MAALTLDPTAVLGSVNGEPLPAGEDIDAGEVVYKLNNTWRLAQCDDTAAKSVARAIALNSAKTGQTCEAMKTGTLTADAVFTKGVVYVLDGTDGKMCPSADLASDDYVTIIGVGASTTTLLLGINATQILKP